MRFVSLAVGFALAGQGIYNQILAINPDYVAAPYDNSTEIVARDDGNDVSKLERRYTISCRVMATGWSGDAWEGGSGVSISCRSAAAYIQDIILGCCKKSSVGSKGPVTGHIYDQDFSVWAGYGNCGHSTTRGPSTYPYPGGSPNGLCLNF
ncbi:hypothetical protein B0H66DRAFT_604288 [Apodospora peruviana]|uniref:Uncharacterized protein n=1 Tax=Apodospora peruviana TaxID=516989 RepID=A0AAE0M2X5_9PEZI|nr:hypothetical protein B0H66DRAFT_604288 [Apodospora peruviana]